MNRLPRPVAFGPSLRIGFLLSLLLPGLLAAQEQPSPIPDPTPGPSAEEVAPTARVNIAEGLSHIMVNHLGREIRVERNQDLHNHIDQNYALTSRPCPPFCIQPMHLSDGVETVGELEVLDYLRRINEGDNSIVLVDSRTEGWLNMGMIPGAVHIPWTALYYRLWDQETLAEMLELSFDVVRAGDVWDFSHAKTLALYCNGAWCGQSASNIRSLLRVGYPPSRLKWYRGGMQSWKQLGLTTVLPDGTVMEE